MARGFERRFESAQTLAGLLELAGSELPVEALVERMRAAQAAGESSADFIPTLFDGEPRFPDPSLAQRLFQNLLGLWDLVAAGQRIRLEAPPPRREKKVPAPAPPPFAPAAPDAAFVEAAWRHVADLDAKGMERRVHAFENRQDALCAWLDEAKLSDDGYAVARHLLFELATFIELGWPKGLRSLTSADLSGKGEDAPDALKAYAEEALFEAEQDEQAPLAPAEASEARDRVTVGLRALWGARRA